MRRKFPVPLRIRNAGQTSVEYILLIVVLVALGMTIMGRVQQWIAGGAQNCGPQNTSLTCRISNAFPSGGYGSYRYYPFY